MKTETRFAQQQLLGYFHAKRGFSLIHLIENMGLSKKEWNEIKRECELDITEQEKNEIEHHFSEKIFS